MRARRAARESHDRTAGVRLPVRRAEPYEGGHEVHAARVGNLARQVLGFGRLGDQLEPVAQPLDRGPSDEDAALERVHRLAPRPARDRREQPVLRHGPAVAGVEEQEGASAIRVLRLPWLRASLAE